MLQEVEVSSHATTSCTRAAMQMGPSASRSEEPASAHHPGPQYTSMHSVTGKPLTAPVVVSAADVTCRLLQLGLGGIGSAVSGAGICSGVSISRGQSMHCGALYPSVEEIVSIVGTVSVEGTIS